MGRQSITARLNKDFKARVCEEWLDSSKKLTAQELAELYPQAGPIGSWLNQWRNGQGYPKEYDYLNTGMAAPAPQPLLSGSGETRPNLILTFVCLFLLGALCFILIDMVMMLEFTTAAIVIIVLELLYVLLVQWFLSIFKIWDWFRQ